jgi:saccharopine dehydrogenase-like NADP-dependent oxidoreductase
MKIAILGGYGNTGLRLARILATSGRAEVVLLGRDDARLRTAADRIGRDAPGQVTWRTADASSGPSLRAALGGASLLVVASSTTTHAGTVARTALEAGVDYLDTNLSIGVKHEALQALRPAVEERGLCFITDGGFHPGLPAAMVRYAALRLPGLTKANVGASFNLPWASLRFSADSQAEFVAELRDMDNSAFVDGAWLRSWKNLRSFDFGPSLGTRSCAALFLKELAELPDRIPTLRETGFFIAGFGTVVDYLVMPACLLWLRLFPGRPLPAGRLMLGALRHLGSPGSWAVLQLEGGDSNGRTVSLRLRHEDPYEMTVIPVAACIAQYADGPRRPGLWMQAGYVEPARFLRDIASMGVEVDLRLDGEMKPP